MIDTPTKAQYIEHLGELVSYAEDTWDGNMCSRRYSPSSCRILTMTILFLTSPPASLVIVLGDLIQGSWAIPHAERSKTRPVVFTHRCFELRGYQT